MKRAEKWKLLTDHYLDLFSVAMGILRDESDARDAVQEALIQTMSKPLVKQPFNYCLRAVRNESLDLLKRRQRLVSFEDVLLVTDVEEERLKKILAEKKAELSDLARAVVELHDEDGYTLHDVAGMMRISVSSVKRLLAGARCELRKKLEKEI